MLSANEDPAATDRRQRECFWKGITFLVPTFLSKCRCVSGIKISVKTIKERIFPTQGFKVELLGNNVERLDNTVLEAPENGERRESKLHLTWRATFDLLFARLFTWDLLPLILPRGSRVMLFLSRRTRPFIANLRPFWMQIANPTKEKNLTIDRTHDQRLVAKRKRQSGPNLGSMWAHSAHSGDCATPALATSKYRPPKQSIIINIIYRNISHPSSYFIFVYKCVQFERK